MSVLGKNLRVITRLVNFQLQRRLQNTQINPQLKVQLGEVTPIFRTAPNFAEKVAIRDESGSYTFANIFMGAKELADKISSELEGSTNQRVLFLCSNDASYVMTLWAIWMSGQIAVPLSSLHPHNMLLYYANDCQSKLIITSPEYADLMTRVSKNSHTRLYVLDEKMKINAAQKVVKRTSDLEGGHASGFYDKNNAVILYTSGTTGNPKGVVLSHKNIISQVNTLVDAWKWTQNDVILHTLPLHHTHGLINALLSPLSIGAKTIMLPKFNANRVWTHLLGVNAKPDDRKITVYMAVPTIYSKLISEYEKVFKKDPKMVEYIKNTLKNKVRLMVSGSAPLPLPVFEKWLDISGHQLLERYGMTEIGMCLSNLYDTKREPGFVGVPLPGVTVRIAENKSKDSYTTLLECTNSNGKIILKRREDIFKETAIEGELLVRSDSVFKEYFNRPEATKKEFTSDQFFKTGDICQYVAEHKKFKMMGRKSVDIIKSGGYKISALQIETLLQGHPDIKDVAVLGLPDEQYGEKIAAVVVLKEGTDFAVELTVENLGMWAAEKLPKYSIPTVLKLVPEIPKNAMGKVNKKELVKDLFEETS